MFSLIFKFIKYLIKYSLRFIRFILAIIGLGSLAVIIFLLYSPSDPIQRKTKEIIITSAFKELQKYDNRENKLINIQINSDSKKKTLNKKSPFPDYLKWDKLSANYMISENSKGRYNTPDSLIFSGGGPKGVAYVGVLEYFQKNNRLKYVNNYIGSSAGSIMCTLISLASIYEKNKKESDPPFYELIKEIMLDTNFLDFIDNSLIKQILMQAKTKSVDMDLNDIISCFSELSKDFALCKGTVIIDFFKKAFRKIGVDENITFAELYKLNHNRLIIVSCSLSYTKTAYFDYKTAPDMPVITAIRSSMAIPYFFAPVKYNNDYFVDGGLTDNYPIEFFGYSEDYSKPSTKCLGFVLNSKEKILRPDKMRINNVGQYSLGIFRILLENIGTALNSRNLNRTVFIDCSDINITSFDLTREEKLELINRGYKATEKCFKDHNK